MCVCVCVCVVGACSVGTSVNTVCGSGCAHQCGCLCNTPPPSCRSACPCDPLVQPDYAFVPGCGSVCVPRCGSLHIHAPAQGVRLCVAVCLRVGVSPWPRQHVTLCTPERQSVSPRARLRARGSVGLSQCVSVSAWVSGCPAVWAGPPSARLGPPLPGAGHCPAPGCRETPARR